MLCIWPIMGCQIIFNHWVISYGDIHHCRKAVINIFGNDNITPPCEMTLEKAALNFTYALVKRKGHLVT